MDQNERVLAFRELHGLDARRPFVLPNAWDALSARAMEEAGAAAIGTTSAGVAWSLGLVDGQRIDRRTMLEVISRICRSVLIPVTADVEGGYGGGTAKDVGETVRGVIGAGAVGINLGDTPGEGHDTLIPISDQAERVAAAASAARAEGVAIFINARLDSYSFLVGSNADRLDLTIQRARACLEAGADGVFVPGVAEPHLVAALATAIPAPLNIMAQPDTPNIETLGVLGVRRVSVGPGIVLRVLGLVTQLTDSLLKHETFDCLQGGWPFYKANSLWEHTACRPTDQCLGPGTVPGENGDVRRESSVGSERSARRHHADPLDPGHAVGQKE